MSSDDFYTEIKLAATTAAPLFNMFRWTYLHGVPTADDIEDMITGLVNDVAERFEEKPGEYSVASGRFLVIIYEDGEGGACLDIKLELAEGYINGEL